MLAVEKMPQLPQEQPAWLNFTRADGREKHIVEPRVRELEALMASSLDHWLVAASPS